LGGFAKYQEPITKASFAECLFSKIVHCTTFSLWSEFPTLAFCSPYVKKKRPFIANKVHRSGKNVHPRGGASL
jgi:hypothetical protein